MRLIRSFGALLGLLIVLGAEAKAQVAFQPVVQSFPNGVSLGATPVVSHDRRYVRLTLNPQFTALEAFDQFALSGGAVAGGGGVGVGGLGGLGLGGLGGLGGGAGAGAGAGRNGLMAVPVKPSPAGKAAGKRIAVDAGPPRGAVAIRAHSSSSAAGQPTAARPQPERANPAPRRSLPGR
jgi:hypothetical protein